MPLDAEDARSISLRIAEGHAWRDHWHEFPELTGAGQFAQFIDAILQEPSAERGLRAGGAPTGTTDRLPFVIVSSADPDGGTSFRPAEGREYFESVP